MPNSSDDECLQLKRSIRIVKGRIAALRRTHPHDTPPDLQDLLDKLDAGEDALQTICGPLPQLSRFTKVDPAKIKRGVDLISDALPFGPAAHTMGFVSPLSSHLNRTSCFSSRQASCFLIHPNRFDATGYKAARLSRSACRSMRLLKLPLPSTIATNGLALARIARVFCSGVRSPISIIDEPVGDRLTRRSRSALLTQLACSHVSSGPSSTHSPAPPFCRAWVLEMKC